MPEEPSKPVSPLSKLAASPMASFVAVALLLGLAALGVFVCPCESEEAERPGVAASAPSSPGDAAPKRGVSEAAASAGVASASAGARAEGGALQGGAADRTTPAESSQVDRAGASVNAEEAEADPGAEANGEAENGEPGAPSSKTDVGADANGDVDEIVLDDDTADTPAGGGGTRSQPVAPPDADRAKESSMTAEELYLAAKAAYDKRAYREAYRIASRSYNAEKSPRTQALRGRAACHMKDEKAARAIVKSFKLRDPERKELRKFCKKLGVNTGL